MLNDLLFEIQCAEEVGAFRIADNLDNKLLKLATQSHKQVIRSITKTFDHNSGVKNVNYSASRKKFIIEADSSIPNSIKKEIKNIANPYDVSFRYSSKEEEDEAKKQELEKFFHDLEKLKEEDHEAYEEILRWLRDNEEPTREELEIIERNPVEKGVFPEDFPQNPN